MSISHKPGQKVAQPRGEPRVALFEDSNATGLENTLNQWLASKIQHKQYGGGEVEVMPRGEKLLAIVRYVEVVAIDYFTEQGQYLYSETPSGLRVQEA